MTTIYISWHRSTRGLVLITPQLPTSYYRSSWVYDSLLNGNAVVTSQNPAGSTSLHLDGRWKVDFPLHERDWKTQYHASLTVIPISPIPIRPTCMPWRFIHAAWYVHTCVKGNSIYSTRLLWTVTISSAKKYWQFRLPLYATPKTRKLSKSFSPCSTILPQAYPLKKYNR